MLSLSTIFPEDLQIFFCHLSSESINFLQAIEITSGKAFRLFSEHRKSSILLDSSLSKEKIRNRRND